MPDKPEVGFGFGVEGDQSLLATIRALREELKNVQQQQHATASSAEVLQRAWRGLVELAAALKLAQFAHEVFDTAVALGKLSQITGIATQHLSVYYKAAKDVGVAHEAVDKGLAKLSRSFVQLQAGNGGAAAGFRLLHLTVKDFIGLSPDEKVRKVTDAFAVMKDSPEKAAAAIALFGKAGAQLIPVLNQLGGEEFAKVRDQAERLGLIFSQDMAEGALRAKAALADLEGVAEGATAQFETGLLPALADVADALVNNISGDGTRNGFKTLGEYAGNTLKFIFNVISSLGIDIGNLAETVVQWVSFEFENLKQRGAATFHYLSRAAHLDFSGAKDQLARDFRDIERLHQDANDRISAIWKNANEQQQKTFDTIWHGGSRKLPPKDRTGEPGDVKGAELDKTGRAELSGLKQQAQDELALHKALTQRELEEDKRAYDQGLLSLEDYFDRRRAVIQQGFIDEIKTLGAEKLGLQNLLAKAEAQGAVTPQQELGKQKEILGIKQQIAHVDSQLAIELTKRDTELDKNENERAKAKQDHLLKELESQKKLADLEGDRAKSAQLASQIEDLELRKTLQQLGRNKAEIDDFLARYGTARTVRSGGEAAKQDFGGELSSFENRKASIEARAALGSLAGGIGQAQAERELKALYQEEIPLLEKKVEKLRQQAALAQRGSDVQKQFTKEAEDESRKIEKLRLEMAKLTQQWKTEVQSSVSQVGHTITTGFNGWIQGQERFGKAAQRVWNSILMTAIESIERIAAEWITKHILMAAVAKAMKLVGLGGGDDGDSEKRSAKATGAIQTDAAQAAADVFAQAISQIPFPANLAAAPALAAATEAQVMAFQAQAIAGGASGAASGFAAGGYVARSMLAGGFIRGPGSSTSDSIPAMLSDREYVVSARGVRSVGVETLDMINRGALNGAFLPPIRHPAPYTAHGLSRYASGGIVKTLASSGGGKGAGAAMPAVHMTNQFNAIDSQNFREHIEEHLDYIADGIKARMRNFRF